MAELVLSHHDSASLLGIPFAYMPEGGKAPITTRAIPEWFMEGHEALQNGRKAVVFVDEFNLGDKNIMNASLKFISSKRLGNIKLPKRLPIMAACNPEEVALYPTPIGPPIQTRFLMYAWDVDPEATIAYFRGEDVTIGLPETPENWEERIPETRRMIADFLEVKPEYVANIEVNPSLRMEQESYALPRTWDYGADVLAWCLATGIDERLTRKFIEGLVGKPAAREFMEFAAHRDLNSPESYLKDPHSFVVPERGDKVHSILSGVVTAFSRTPTEDRWKNAWIVVGKAFASEGGRAASVAAGRQLMRFNVSDWKVPAKMAEILDVKEKPKNDLGSILGGPKKSSPPTP